MNNDFLVLLCYDFYMKIISLNIWNGRLPTKLRSFFNERTDKVDVLCFQEVFSAHNISKDNNFVDTPEKLQNLLGKEYSYITDNNGLMICYKNQYVVKDQGITEVFRMGDFRKNLLWAILSIEGKDFFIGTIHGIWANEGRGDTPERIKQSQVIKEIFDKHQTNKILCGDFNLLPSTQSIAILEEDMINLVKKYNIVTTRTPMKKRTNLDKDAEAFADYIFISQDIEVKDFKVLTEIVSDHYPLMLQIK